MMAKEQMQEKKRLRYQTEEHFISERVETEDEERFENGDCRS